MNMAIVNMATTAPEWLGSFTKFQHLDILPGGLGSLCRFLVLDALSMALSDALLVLVGLGLGCCSFNLSLS
jgi:hypothetical protein